MAGRGSICAFVFLMVLGIALCQPTPTDDGRDSLERLTRLVWELRGDNMDLRKELQELRLMAREQTTGTVYVRWGRTTCREGATALYRGYMAGAHTAETGGTSQHLCLPDAPQWGRYRDGVQSGGRIWGTEYHNYHGYGPSSPFLLKTNNHGQSVYMHDVPCVLCHVTGRATTWTFPAMTSCPAGWQTEYQGYLMLGYYGHAGRVKHECVDEAPEVVPGSGEYRGGSTLHFMETRCTPLPCPPYVEGRELTCAVCSR